MANFNFKPSSDAATQVQKSKGGSGINEYVASLYDQSLTWEDVTWLKSITKLPLVVKGILRPDEALEAVSHGASAVIGIAHLTFWTQLSFPGIQVSNPVSRIFLTLTKSLD